MPEELKGFDDWKLASPSYLIERDELEEWELIEQAKIEAAERRRDER